MEDELEKISAFEIDNVSAEKYLKDVTQILAEYAWVYRIRNTDILRLGVLENIPSSWCVALNDLSYEDFCQLPFNFIKDDWPPSLLLFISECHRLGNFRFPPSNLHDVFQDKLNYVPEKVPSKKKLEIQTMAYVINKVCKDIDCHLVLDIGSGLGYLDQVLHHGYKLKCIGLDSSVRYTMTANDRLSKDSCKKSMLHKTLEVTHSEKCLEDIRSILNEKQDLKCYCFSTKKAADSVAMVGLHCCGNLTQDMMKLFCEMNEVAALVCLGCCYNKINLSDFPMSKTAQGVLKDFPEWKPSISGLRLAAHGTRLLSVHTSMHSNSLKCHFYRAVLELYVRRENIAWQQPKRHTRSADLVDFDTYCKNMLSKHPLGNDETTFKNLHNLLDEWMPLFPRVRILLILQLLLQPLWEGFITLDRVLFFREKSMAVNVLALWDDGKSSRNLALCVYKR